MRDVDFGTSVKGVVSATVA